MLATTQEAPPSPNRGHLLLLHLSDIHFHRASGDPFDIDGDLRNELLIDAQTVKESLGPPDAVLIGGDVAYKGAPGEYNFAKDWLSDLCRTFGRTIEIIWCVPGNHDVDRAVVDESVMLRDLHERLRTGAGLDEYLRDAHAKTLLFTPLAEYNKFAASFGCAISCDAPYWDQPFTLNDGSTLIVRGLNSTIVSDKLDDTRDVLLGQYQVPQRQDGVAHMVLCHHPPSEWIDRDLAEAALDNRAVVQLFGHKHVQKVNKSGNTLKVSAGAVHPSRTESGWRPRYNWLLVRVSGPADNRKLLVTVYPRVWDHTDRFSPDFNVCGGKTHCEYSLDLDPWRSPAPPACPSSTDPLPASHSSPVPEQSAGESAGATTIMNADRTLTYRFFDLPHIARIDIARSLGLYKDEDEGIPDSELFSRLIKRASSENKLPDLWDGIESKHNDGRYPYNPFRRM